MRVDSRHDAILEGVENRFGLRLICLPRLRTPNGRDDVWGHCFFDPDHKRTDQLTRDIRRFVEDQGWQWSRQHVPIAGSAPAEYIYLTPIVELAVEVGYHATRRASVPSIMEQGLEPSSPDRQTTARADCEGNIYFCERLGSSADAGVRGSVSAHWWRDHLASTNRFEDSDWVILSVEIGRLVGARVYKDIWSESGIIVDNIARISPDLIRLESD